jgi:PAS domain S-box-containing protein
MAGKSTYDPLDHLDSDSKVFQFRSIEERELEKEQRRFALKLLRRRDNILKAVYLFTERFLRMPLAESKIEPILEELGYADEVSRVYVFENHQHDDGTLVTSQQYEWASPGTAPEIANPNLIEMPWVEAGFERWMNTLSKGKLIYGCVADFPESERTLLAAQNIISIMVAPIFIGDHWWGFIGFDDCRSRREWAPVEIEALKTAANIIGAAIQRKQADEAVLDSEKKYRLVVDNANEGIVITQDGMLKFVNPQAKDFTGFSEDNFKTVNFSEYIHPEDRQMVIEHHRKRLSGEEIPQIYSLRMIDREGNVRWVQNNGVLIEWEGRPATLNFLLDITARKQAVDALAESEEKYRQLFESDSDAIMIFDSETRLFEDANPATLDLFGYSKEEFLSLTVEDISAEIDKTRISVNKVSDSATTSMKIPLRYFRCKDGRIFPGEISAGKFISGGKQKILGAVRDISERIRTEDKIRALTREQIKVQEEERNRIARYLHDHVAQDLSTLKISIETLFDDPDKLATEKKKKLSEISRILQESISSDRDLSYDLRPAGMDQLGLVKTTYQLCEDFSQKNKVPVDFFSAGIDALKLDFDTAINIYRLIQEGFNNIRKHARADKVIIRLVASSPNIILRIEDDGQGFDVTNRLSTALKEKRMGLSSMEERVSLLGGKMDIKSRIGRGTRILIEIPWQEIENGR